MVLNGKYGHVVSTDEPSGTKAPASLAATEGPDGPIQTIQCEVAIVGAGPAGLIAAEILSRYGRRVTVFEAMPSPARKLLMAGRGGLNLTHSEPIDALMRRYGSAAEFLAPYIAAYSPTDLRTWADGLGAETFCGSSGRIFPKAMKSSPLLRAWLGRLVQQGVDIRLRHRWAGWSDEADLLFSTNEAARMMVSARATLIATGGASWPRLGSDGAALAMLANRGVATARFRPHNAGAKIDWSPILLKRFEGAPLKRIEVRCGKVAARGEAVITRSGLEGGCIYSLNMAISEQLNQPGGGCVINIDLRPDLDLREVEDRLRTPRGRMSAANFLRKAVGLSACATALLREPSAGRLPDDLRALAKLIKSVPFRVNGLGDLARAISSAGGISWSELTDGLMLKRKPGVFVAGEIIDWTAPTGGYLLQATFATAVAAANGIEAFLAGRKD